MNEQVDEPVTILRSQSYVMGSANDGVQQVLFGRLRKYFTHTPMLAKVQGNCDNTIQIYLKAPLNSL